MTFGEMKASFMSDARDLNMNPSVFNFADCIDAGIFFVASVFPAEVINSIMRVYSVDASLVGGDQRMVPLPSDFLKVESVNLAKNRILLSSNPDIYGGPISLPATIVSQRKFLIDSEYSETPMASFFNGVMYYNPAVAPESQGYAGSITLVYRKVPLSFRVMYNRNSNGGLISGITSTPGSNILNLASGDLFSNYNINPSNFNGGSLLFEYMGQVMNFGIDYGWSSGSGDGFHVGGPFSVPNIPDMELTKFLVSESPERSHSYSSSYVSDNASTDIGSEWHHLIVDYAKSKYFASRNKEVSQLISASVARELQAVGINSKIEFGGEEA